MQYLEDTIAGLFACLFKGLSSHSRIFHSHGDVTITGEGLHILTYARHSWSLSSEGSIACHTYCGTGHPFLMVILEDLWRSHLLPSVKQWSCHNMFLRLRIRIRTPYLPLVGHRFNTVRNRRSLSLVEKFMKQKKQQRAIRRHCLSD